MVLIKIHFGGCSARNGAKWGRQLTHPVFRDEPNTSNPFRRAKGDFVNIHRTELLRILISFEFVANYSIQIGSEDLEGNRR